MLQKVKNAVNLVENMGWRYISFRTKHEFLRRTGLLKNKFPVNPTKETFVTLKDWKQGAGRFFFDDKESLKIPINRSAFLEERFNDYRNGKIWFFNSIPFNIGNRYDWVTNPDSGHRYDINSHWTEIPDYSREAGDIKYVWEKSRFSFLYDIIRYDYHFNQDCSEIVFDEILSWIEKNPVNCGPNYGCSQEISLRVLNWTFTLYYYKNSNHLTDSVFNEIQHAIYWQMHHVYQNIDFSRIAVRNNHAITETMALYLVSLFYPMVKDFKVWGHRAKKWFEEEVAYQVYEDGTFLQFSMNYHRVVVQLLTWGIRITEKNSDRFSEVVYDRARRSLEFLRVCMDDSTGWLPNYGANDGALFFRLNNDHFRDYRSQLKALGSILNIDAAIDNESEDESWYGGSSSTPTNKINLEKSVYSFEKGGYYIFREKDTLTFTRCGNHKDRPSQADNLHLDIWYQGNNILHDAGSYKYNTDEEVLKYFMGTASHNTVMLNGYDQMKKGSRFIWYDWSQCEEAKISEENSQVVFSGEIAAYGHIDKKIRHHRTIIKKKFQPEWHIHDRITHLPEGIKMKQLWHLPSRMNDRLFVESKNENGKPLEIKAGEGFHSPVYGYKEIDTTLEIVSDSPEIFTVIKIRI